MRNQPHARSISQRLRNAGARKAGRPASPVSAGAVCTERIHARLLELLPQVRFIARRIHRHLPNHVPVEDLYQAGVLGLLDALRKFDPHRRVRLESYMKFRIRGAILDELRSLDWSPRELRRRGRKLDEAHQELCVRLGREPSHGELAVALHISLRQLEALRGELRGLEINSLQEIAMTTDDGVEKDRASLVPCPASLGPQAMYAGQENRERLAEAIARLPENERQVLSLYYYEELTMKEVGEVLGVGESRVSQIHSAALQRVRGWMSRSPACDSADGIQGALAVSLHRPFPSSAG